MNSPIFIVGTPRSGTTLIAKILTKHSRVFIPGETHFFDDIYFNTSISKSLEDISTIKSILNRLSTIYFRYNEPEDQERIEYLFKDKSIFNSMLERGNSWRDIYRWFFEIQMHHEGKARWGNQVPRDLFNVSEILNFFPEAKFIICIRDLKDFLVSYKNKWKKATHIQNRRRLKNLYHPVVTSFLWKSSMNRIEELKQHFLKENSLIVRYEDLVIEPERTLREICCCINESFEDEMLSINFSNSSFSPGEGRIYKSSVGRWRQELSPEEIVISQLICSKELIKHGYDIIPLHFSISKIFAILALTPLSLLKGLSSNSKMIGSMLKYLSKRMRPIATKML